MITDFAHIKEGIKGDRFLWTIIILLSLCSLLAVYSASISLTKYNSDNTLFFLFKHVPFILGGLVLAWIVSQVQYSEFSRLAPVLLIIAVILLVWAMFFGVNVNQAKRWIQVPFLDITFQVSDFAKIALICYVARSISAKQDYIKSFKTAFVPIMLPVLVVCGLIAPSNFSTSALLFVCCIMMLFVGRVSIKYILILGLFGILMFAFLIFIGQFLPDSIRVSTWISRINEFIYVEEGGYQVQQAKIAIARGGLFGQGPGNSMLRNFIPYSYADFIYAIICEEWGILLGGIGLIVIYLMLLGHCVSVVTKTPKAFGAMLTIGIGFNIVMQAFANMGVSLGVVPVTGLTLPFVSMGGTSLLFTSIAFGMIISVSKNINALKLEPDTHVDLDQNVSSNEGID
ncbi:MAG: FtsW/RodA/SpoVE family cell cycle protein [Saprospiraceae bacterium]|uniref:Probable peptidoglycan glycosyltransferase FtsW n=1 Tax=Candidatus Defluviibacterium haderslevense TaxID=2981993 RepID=A0A9D7SCJ4_9BACT|nr:FtsW/RodA/SpoVE family cell cycle protein [Candidatus Defluviibacterium haderslevense]MBK9718699.1 FtsW/RodA/SpoVE family cell cycle protein [Candidatus Defluviibacterium haderslevense]MBL0235230.1 FtsW/RodA/SpoVE family cell cycle protein [Candidatus Defluviibacterium haderslevense]